MTQRAQVLMILWRIWHVHNEVTHQKPLPSVEGSRRFLLSYLESLTVLKQHSNADFEKGKMVVNPEMGLNRGQKRDENRPKVREKWEAPPGELTKLNVDGSFGMDGSAGVGMVLRDSSGGVIFTACRQLINCRDAVDAELAALEEGLSLAMVWTPRNIIAETDCAEVCELIKDSTPNTSTYMTRVGVIRDLIRERAVKVSRVGRDKNCVSHELARIGRVDQKTELWLGDFPPEIRQHIDTDCNFIIP
jgi:ribonuclease HI